MNLPNAALYAKMITAYVPTLDKWEADLKTRKQEAEK